MENIETPRLILRKFVKEDFEDFWEYYSQPVVRESAGLSPVNGSTYIWARIRLEAQDTTRFAIVYKPEMKLVGEIELTKPDVPSAIPEGFEHGNVREVSYMLNQNYHRRGIMSEGVRAVLKAGFETMNIDGFYLYCFARNIASLKLSMKSGFRFLSNDKVDIGGQNFAVFSMGISKTDYLKDTGAKTEIVEKPLTTPISSGKIIV